MTNERRVAAELRLAGKVLRGERDWGFSAEHWLARAERHAQLLSASQRATTMATIAALRAGVSR